jgi:hypothetical protein
MDTAPPTYTVKRMRTFLSSALLCSFLATVLFGQAASPKCEDQWREIGYDPAKVYAFVAALKQAVATDDRERVSSMIDYPLNVLTGSHPSRIATKSLFLKKYVDIFTPHVKGILAAQRSNEVCITSNAFMIGRGEIWFDEIATGDFKIVTVTPR